MDIKSLFDKIERKERLSEEETRIYIDFLIERAGQIEHEDPKRFLEILKINNDHFEQALSQIDGLADAIQARLEEIEKED